MGERNGIINKHTGETEQSRGKQAEMRRNDGRKSLHCVMEMVFIAVRYQVSGRSMQHVLHCRTHPLKTVRPANTQLCFTLPDWLIVHLLKLLFSFATQPKNGLRALQRRRLNL